MIYVTSVAWTFVIKQDYNGFPYNSLLNINKESDYNDQDIVLFPEDINVKKTFDTNNLKMLIIS